MALVHGDTPKETSLILENIGYADPESEEGMDNDVTSRRYRALLPEDDYDSDDY